MTRATSSNSTRRSGPRTRSVIWLGACIRTAADASRLAATRKSFPMWINASADTSLRETLQELDGTISILQREHDRLIPLVVEDPPHLRPLRMRQLKSIAKRLSSARFTGRNNFGSSDHGQSELARGVVRCRCSDRLPPLRTRRVASRGIAAQERRSGAAMAPALPGGSPAGAVRRRGPPIRDYGAEAYGEACRRERDVILADGTTHTGRTPAHWWRVPLWWRSLFSPAA